MHDYNYATFPLDLCGDEFAAFRDALPAGTRAPDGVLVDAATGDEVRLGDLWSRGTLVLEFGSFT